MYADRTASRGVKRSVKDRLGGGPLGSPALGANPRSALKRQRQDDLSWTTRIIRERVHAVKDNALKDFKSSVTENDPLRSSGVSIRNMESTKKSSVIAKTVSTSTYPIDETKGTSATKLVSAKKPINPSASAPSVGEKKHVVAEELNLAAFLQKLGLSKYHITFQAEEVDMFALKHMNDDDLKAIGVPMGPRKKILYALAPARAKK